MAALGLALACHATLAMAQNRALTIRDVISMESFGAALLDPVDRWLAYEKRGPYDSAPAYDLDIRSVWGVSDLWIVDLSREECAERLLPGEGPGLMLGAWSPSGQRLLVYRLRDDIFEAGIVEMGDRSVWWTGLAAEVPFTGATASWLDDRRLAVTALQDGRLPWLLRHARGGQEEMMRQWATAASGRVASRTVVDTSDGMATSETPTRRRHLTLLDVDRREKQVITEGVIRDWSASPDGTTIAVLSAGGATPVNRGALRQMVLAERGQLSIVNIDTGKVVSTSDQVDVAPHLLRWSWSSDAVLVWLRENGSDWSEGDLSRVSADGDIVRINRHGLSPLAPGADIDLLAGVRADWIGATPILYARQPDASRFDWYALTPGVPPQALTADFGTVPARLSSVTETEALVFADDALWAIGPNIALRRVGTHPLSEAQIPDRMAPVRLRVNSPLRRDDVLAIDQGGRILRMNANAGETMLGRRPDQGQNSVLDATGRAAVSVLRMDGTEQLLLARSQKTHGVDSANAALEGLSLVRPVPLRHFDAAGASATSWLFLPPDRSDDAVRGVIVLAYPGAVDDGGFLSPLTLLYGPRAAMIAAEGYAVLSPSLPVSESGSAEMRSLEMSLDLALEALQDARPQLPHSRMALLGHSFGGYFAISVAGRSTRFRSYIAWAPVTDFFGIWGEFTPTSRSMPEEGFTLRQQMGWVEARQGGMAGPPWMFPADYMDASPYLSAAGIGAPLLLITADRDYVPMSQAERMFTALNRQEKRARLVTYWGEGHTNVSPANILDVYDQILSWLEETLGDGVVQAEPPRPAPNLRSPPPS